MLFRTLKQDDIFLIIRMKTRILKVSIITNQKGTMATKRETCLLLILGATRRIVLYKPTNKIRKFMCYLGKITNSGFIVMFLESRPGS